MPARDASPRFQFGLGTLLTAMVGLGAGFLVLRWTAGGSRHEVMAAVVGALIGISIPETLRETFERYSSLPIVRLMMAFFIAAIWFYEVQDYLLVGAGPGLVGVLALEAAVSLARHLRGRAGEREPAPVRHPLDDEAPAAPNPPAAAPPTAEEMAAALHRYARWGHLGQVEMLLAEGVDPNARDAAGRTPLHQAARNGHGPVVNVLLAAGADPNLRDDADQTPVEVAAAKGFQTVVRLLEPSAPKDQRPMTGDQTPQA